MFKSLISGCYCEALVDSGASHSFVSLHFLTDNTIPYKSADVAEASLADGSPTPIVGVVRDLRMKIGHFRFTESFLVVDVRNLEVVLGMSFLEQHNLRLDWKRRCMHVVHKNT